MREFTATLSERKENRFVAISDTEQILFRKKTPDFTFHLVVGFRGDVGFDE
jgi:hypothetical protein